MIIEHLFPLLMVWSIFGSMILTFFYDEGGFVECKIYDVFIYTSSIFDKLKAIIFIALMGSPFLLSLFLLFFSIIGVYKICTWSINKLSRLLYVD